MRNEYQMPVWPGWKTIGVIGEGSYGKVYEIRRELYGFTEKAALKVISIPKNQGEIDEMLGNGYDQESIYHTLEHRLHNILDEYKLMRKMNGHSNVVNCDDVNCVEHEDGIGWDIYIKMELLTPLLKAMPQKIDEDMVIKVARDMCSALELCRKYGIIHRDIKPQNIFVSDSGDYKLGDFGIAKTVEKTMGGTKAGTYNYMAPEVFWNKPYGVAADICSLGVVLYWMLNERRLPFLPLAPAKIVGDMESNARNRRLYGEALPDPAHGSKELKRIVLKACSNDLAVRYSDAGQMLADLDALSGHSAAAAAGWAAGGWAGASVHGGTVGGDDGTMVDGGGTVLDGDGTVLDGDGTMVDGDGTMVDDDGKGGDVGTILTPPVLKFDVPPRAPKKKKGGLLKILIPVAAAAAAALILLPGGNSGKPAETTAPTIPTEPPLKGMGEWSDWVEVLPEEVNADTYLIQERPLYRSRELEVTSSAEKTEMNGWTYVETKEEPGEYGQWSDWSATEAIADELREVETQTRYRYKTKETKTSSESEMSGWTKYDTKKEYQDYGDWSDWSTTKVSETDTRQVDTKKQYASREKQYTTSDKSSLSGWTQYDQKTSYGEWGSWSDWSSEAVSESDTREVRTQKVEIPGETKYVYGAYFSSDSPKVGSNFPHPCATCAAATYGGTWTYQTRTESKALQGSSVQYSCSHVGSIGRRYTAGNGRMYYYEKVKVSEGVSKTEYSSRTRSKNTTYSYYKWGDWSSWSDSKISASDSREVKDRTLYRSRTCKVKYTYHFYRWTDWSDWSETAVSESSSKKVEKSTFYRYRDRQMLNVNYFNRWTDWTDFSAKFVAPSETCQVESKLTLRYATRPTDGSEDTLKVTYTDVPEGSYFYDAVNWVNDRGIMKGVSNDQFAPGDGCTKRQMVILLWRAKGYPEPTAAESPFTDVTVEDPYRKAILWAVEAGIVNGSGSNLFEGEAPCTRGQAITFLYRAMGSPDVLLKQEPFEDVDEKDYFFNAVLWAYEHSISSGVTTTSFGVDEPCKRDQVAVMLYRAMAS